MDKCTHGMVMDTCVQRSAQTNKLYRYRMINGGLLEKKSLNVGDYFKHESRIYEVLQVKDSYGSHKVKCVLFRFAKPYSKCESGNDEMVYGGWLYARGSFAENWSEYSLVLKVDIVISVRN